MRPHRRQPTRLPRPWDSPGKNTGVGCHFLLQCMKAKSESEVAQSCPTLRDPMVCSLPGSSVHGIFQARVLEWGAIAFSIPVIRQGYKQLCWLVEGPGIARLFIWGLKSGRSAPHWLPWSYTSTVLALRIYQLGPTVAVDGNLACQGLSMIVATLTPTPSSLSWSDLQWSNPTHPLWSSWGKTRVGLPEVTPSTGGSRCLLCTLFPLWAP